MATKQKLLADCGVHRRLLYEEIRKLGLDETDQILEDETLDSNGAL
jgi:hypothetical protein